MVKDWHFAEIWNDSLVNMAERPTQFRDYIYASELGGPMIDRYLKMLGTKPTNPPNNRSLRKFQAGNIWEWIVGFVLQRAGILKRKQVRAEVQLDGLLRVSGRLDFVAGGKMDYDKAVFEINQLDLPEFLYHASLKIVEQLKTEYTDTDFIEAILEAKSVSSFVFERARKVKRCNPNHKLQNFHYLWGTDISFGKVLYVCKDDCRLLEYPVYKSAPDTLIDYKKDVEEITYYFTKKKAPKKEDELLFDDATGKFRHNWRVEYSNYLSLLYGYKTPKEYRDKYSQAVASFNRTFKRCVDGANMTDNNKQTIKAAKKIFPQWDEYVELARQNGVLELVEDEEID